MGKDLQRALLWVILFSSLFLLWDNYQVYKGEPSFFQQEQVAQTAEQAPVDQTIPKEQEVTAVASGAATEVKSELVTIETDRQKITFDLRGAQIVGSEMLTIPNQPDWKDHGLAGFILGNTTKTPEELGNVVLLEKTANRTYTAQAGFVGNDLPNHLDQFKLVSTNLKMGRADGLDVVFSAEKNGVVVTRTYSFKRGDYAIQVKTDLKNNTDKSITPTMYYQITRDDGPAEGDNVMYSTYTGMAFYSDEENFQKVSFGDIADDSASFIKKAADGWVAMIQHHFVSAWIPARGQERENFVYNLGNKLYSAGVRMNLGTVNAGSRVSNAAIFYTGPQTQERLEALAPGLDLVVDYGWLTFLAKPIYMLLSFLYGLVGNWGWAIVLLTCIVKLILYPISAAGYRSMARLKEVTPRIKAIQDRYKDDKERLNKAMLELYTTEKINPIGGCLPILLQIPVFLALYWVLQGSIELRGARWILWIHDLGLPDPWFILPALMAGTMFLQIFLNPKPADPVQARVMYIMPLVFSVMFFIFASGLVLYWLTNNILSIVQQWWINKTIAVEMKKKK